MFPGNNQNYQIDVNATPLDKKKYFSLCAHNVTKYTGIIPYDAIMSACVWKKQ